MCEDSRFTNAEMLLQEVLLSCYHIRERNNCVVISEELKNTISGYFNKREIYWNDIKEKRWKA